jgi:hypothetical protein
MSVHPLSSAHAIDPLHQARIDLAAAHRLAVLHELEEGIDNPPPANDRHRGERERLFFEAMMRVLDRDLPGYAD